MVSSPKQTIPGQTWFCKVYWEWKTIKGCHNDFHIPLFLVELLFLEGCFGHNKHTHSKEH